MAVASMSSEWLLASRLGRGTVVGFSIRLSAACFRGQWKDTMHVNAWQVDLVWVEFASVDENLDLGDGELTGHRSQRVEIARRLAEDEISVAIALPRSHQPEVTGDRFFEDEVTGLAADGKLLHCFRFAGLLFIAIRGVLLGKSTLGDLAADARGGEKGRYSRATCSEFLGEGSLRDEFHFELTLQVLSLELLVLST